MDNVYSNMRIVVASGGQELCSFKREHMAPGEMEKIVVPKKFLDEAKQAEITIAVVNQEEAK